MQTIEAVISLMILVVLIAQATRQLEGQSLDDSVYRLQLADDVWRVLYLRGNFMDFGESKRTAIEQDMVGIGDETGLCIFLEGTQFTNCRGGRWDDGTEAGDRYEIMASTQKLVVVRVVSSENELLGQKGNANGDGELKEVTFSIGG